MASIEQIQALLQQEVGRKLDHVLDRIGQLEGRVEQGELREAALLRRIEKCEGMLSSGASSSVSTADAASAAKRARSAEDP